MRFGVYQVIGALLIPLVWILVADLGNLVTPAIFPPLGEVIRRLATLVSTGAITIDFFSTVFRWLAGFGLGVVSGIPVGLVIGSSRAVSRLLEFPIEFFRSLPVTAIFPLFLLLFGIEDLSKIAMAFTPTFLLMIVNTSYGVLYAEPTRRRMATVFGATPWQVFWKVVAVDALPQIFVGLRLALAQSLIVTVVSEMFIGTDFGLGQRVYDAYLTSSSTALYAFIIILGIVGYIANRLMLLCEKRALYWAGR